MEETHDTELTLPEAAALLGINLATAYRWAVAGKLTITTHVPRATPRILVSASSVADAKAEGQKGKRKR
mgnify:CR=1 FL=1